MRTIYSRFISITQYTRMVKTARARYDSLFAPNQVNSARGVGRATHTTKGGDVVTMTCYGSGTWIFGCDDGRSSKKMTLIVNDSSCAFLSVDHEVFNDKDVILGDDIGVLESLLDESVWDAIKYNSTEWILILREGTYDSCWLQQ